MCLYSSFTIPTPECNSIPCIESKIALRTSRQLQILEVGACPQFTISCVEFIGLDKEAQNNVLNNGTIRHYCAGQVISPEPVTENPEPPTPPNPIAGNFLGLQVYYWIIIIIIGLAVLIGIIIAVNSVISKRKKKNSI